MDNRQDEIKPGEDSASRRPMPAYQIAKGWPGRQRKHPIGQQQDQDNISGHTSHDHPKPGEPGNNAGFPYCKDAKKSRISVKSVRVGEPCLRLHK